MKMAGSAARNLTNIFAATLKRKQPDQESSTEEKEIVWKKMKVAELKEECKVRGIPRSGNKTLLISKIMKYDNVLNMSEDQSESEDDSDELSSYDDSDDGLMMSPPASSTSRNFSSAGTSTSMAKSSKLSDCKWARDYIGYEKDMIIEMGNGLGGGGMQRTGMSFLKAYAFALKMTVQQFCSLIINAPGKLARWWREAIESDRDYADDDKQKKECIDFLKALDAAEN